VKEFKLGNCVILSGEPEILIGNIKKRIYQGKTVFWEVLWEDGLISVERSEDIIKLGQGERQQIENQASWKACKKAQKRRCLGTGCNRLFSSSGPGHRLCPRCRNDNHEKEGGLDEVKLGYQ